MILDCAAVTSLRTGAAAAVSAQALARPGAETVGIVGCGINGSWAARCLSACGYARGVCADVRPEAAGRLAAELGWETGDVGAALGCDVVVTVTPATARSSPPADLRPGTHLAVLGADGHGKAEVEAAAIAAAGSSATSGSRPRPAASWPGRSSAARSRAADVTDIGAVLTGAAPGRREDDENTLFDSTGLAIQDLGIALAVRDALGRGDVEPASVDL